MIQQEFQDMVNKAALATFMQGKQCTDDSGRCIYFNETNGHRCIAGHMMSLEVAKKIAHFDVPAPQLIRSERWDIDLTRAQQHNVLAFQQAHDTVKGEFKIGFLANLTSATSSPVLLKAAQYIKENTHGF